MTSTRRRNAAVLLLVVSHTTNAFVATTSNRFRSREAAGAGSTAPPGGSVGVRGAETRIAAATGFFENLFGGLKVSTHNVSGARYLCATLFTCTTPC